MMKQEGAVFSGDGQVTATCNDYRNNNESVRAFQATSKESQCRLRNDTNGLPLALHSSLKLFLNLLFQ